MEIRNETNSTYAATIRENSDGRFDVSFLYNAGDCLRDATVSKMATYGTEKMAIRQARAWLSKKA